MTDIPLFKQDGNVRAWDRIQQDVLRRAVDHYAGNRSKAAAHLGIGRSTLYRLLPPGDRM